MSLKPKQAQDYPVEMRQNLERSVRDKGNWSVFSVHNTKEQAEAEVYQYRELLKRYKAQPAVQDRELAAGLLWAKPNYRVREVPKPGAPMYTVWEVRGCWLRDNATEIRNLKL